MLVGCQQDPRLDGEFTRLVRNASRQDAASLGRPSVGRPRLLARAGWSRTSEVTAPPAPAQSGARLAGVEGLRALAAVSILVYHCWLYSAPDGQRVDLGLLSRFALRHLPAGVLLFFTLSGFLLYRPLAASVLRQAPLPSVRRYLRNRALRIFPAYLLILLVVGVLLPAALTGRVSSGSQLGRLTGDPGVLLANAALLQNYVPGSMDTGIGPAWSLAVELVFYLILPLLGWLAATSARAAATPRSRTGAALVPVAVVIAIGLSGSLVAFHVVPPGSGAWHRGVVRSFWFHADLFALGMALAVTRVNLEDGRLRLPSWWRPAAAASLVGVTMATVLLTDRGRIQQYNGALAYETLVTVACALLLALVVLPTAEAPPPANVRLLETRLLVAVGLASYSLFLWHEPVVRWLQQHGLTSGGTAGFWVNLLLVGALSGLLSGLTYRFVERPALRRKTGRPPPGPTPSATGTQASAQAAPSSQRDDPPRSVA
jgi:peptidoglycan/LPS O-acetylase OafA/YrhL